MHEAGLVAVRIGCAPTCEEEDEQSRLQGVQRVYPTKMRADQAKESVRKSDQAML